MIKLKLGSGPVCSATKRNKSSSSMPQSFPRDCALIWSPPYISSKPCSRQNSPIRLNGRLAAKAHPALPMNRFRPNLVVAGSAPYAEDGWGTLRIGEAAFRGVKPCGRCQVTTTDQASGEVCGPEPLATLSEYRESGEFGLMFGMNLVSERSGMIRLGDPVQPE
ncbi:MAG TPA: MOSC domain-containing protein [Usitatibacter sp.]|nr:MOSC domain-containing protein [Usitatibacter sp.]